MKVLITSGSTIEKIDNVRSISNMSTGKLGSLIAERFADEPCIEKIFYVCGRTAIKPQSDKIEYIYVESVSSLEAAVKNLFAGASIDIIIHSMAVSDYRVRAVSSSAIVSNLIVSNLITSNLDAIKHSDHKSVEEAVKTSMKNPQSVIGTDGKISSGIEDMLLFMEQTPKIISLFRSLSPQSTLVGFKLLDNVPLETLIDKGFQILTENKCNFVLANDIKDINGEQHIGYLIDKSKNYKKYSSKAEIADAIVSAVLGERRNENK